jgi:hypothetical protein
MTQQDIDQFIQTIGNLDTQIEDATLDADTPLVAQIGTLAKAVLLLSTLNRYHRPAPPPTCVCSDRPATILAGDWDLCAGCHAAITAFDVAEVEELWLP